MVKGFFIIALSVSSLIPLRCCRVLWSTHSRECCQVMSPLTGLRPSRVASSLMQLQRKRWNPFSRGLPASGCLHRNECLCVCFWWAAVYTKHSSRMCD